MVADMDYYRLVRNTDPTYTIGTAVREYLSDNKDVAVGICYDLGLEDLPFGYDDLRHYLSNMDVIDVLSLGIYCTRPFDFNGYFQFEGDGNLRSLDEREFLSWCFSEACDHTDEIVAGKVPIPPEMSKVLDLWRIHSDVVNGVNNRKPVPKKKTPVKKPAKKASSKKTPSRNVSPKAPARKKTCKKAGTRSSR